MQFNDYFLYHIYPLGMLGAPRNNDEIPADRLPKLLDWIPHIQKLGVNAVYFSPLFQSDRHGYDTRDYYTVDTRLGTNEQLKQVVDALHSAGIKVLFDGVFNHVGRGFFAFKDVQQNKKQSKYRHWFKLSFDGNTVYNDGFWYESWEGHQELVKLNLDNPEVVDYLLGAVATWIDELGIDGLRLDVAYCLNRNFMRTLKAFVKSKRPDFVLLGEMLFGDYKQLVNSELLTSVTNYEFYKSLYSALNSDNLYELSYSQNRQFGYEPWCVYRGLPLATFADNHDVSRFATILNDKNKIRVGYALLFTMVGVPIIYYGSEWGLGGDKRDGDDALRPEIAEPKWTELTDYIATLAGIRRAEVALRFGGYRNLAEGNKSLVFERDYAGESIFVAVNISAEPVTINNSALSGVRTDLLSGKVYSMMGSLTVGAYSALILK